MHLDFEKMPILHDDPSLCRDRRFHYINASRPLSCRVPCAVCRVPCAVCRVPCGAVALAGDNIKEAEVDGFVDDFEGQSVVPMYNAFVPLHLQ